MSIARCFRLMFYRFSAYPIRKGIDVGDNLIPVLWSFNLDKENSPHLIGDDLGFAC